jgi:hypothetical protein
VTGHFTKSALRTKEVYVASGLRLRLLKFFTAYHACGKLHRHADRQTGHARERYPVLRRQMRANSDADDEIKVL